MIRYTESQDERTGVWVVTAALECAACATALGTGGARRASAPTDREARASRDEARSKAAWRASLCGYVRSVAVDGYVCPKCGAGVTVVDGDAARSEGDTAATESLEWGARGVNAVPFITAEPLPNGLAWVVSLVVSVDGLRYACSEYADSADVARVVAEGWMARADECAAAIRAAAALYPNAAQRYRAESLRRFVDAS